MPHRRTSGKPVVRAALSILTVICATAGGAGETFKASRLFKDGRQSLAIARAQGRSDMVLLVASKPGAAAQVAKAAERLGGAVRYREDEIGYLRVRIPIDRVNEFIESDRIEAVSADVDATYPFRLSGPGKMPMTEPRPGMPAPGSRPDGLLSSQPREGGQEWPPRWSDIPLVRPYSPLADIDAAEFRRLHPTFDGRGVTIALLDGNFDLLLPEFQTAYAVDGRKVPKVADFLNVTDPRDDAGQMPQWVDMGERAEARGLRIVIGGKTFTAPADGTFRVGLFSERRWNDPANAAYIDQDLDRNGNPRGDDGTFGVLWDERTNDVRVDTDRDLDFTDEIALTDYRRRRRLRQGRSGDTLSRFDRIHRPDRSGEQVRLDQRRHLPARHRDHGLRRRQQGAGRPARGRGPGRAPRLHVLRKHFSRDDRGPDRRVQASRRRSHRDGAKRQPGVPLL